MTEFQYLDGGNTEAKDRLATSFLFRQDSVGLATDGVLNGLGVTQTGTASVSVLIAAGAAVVQDTVGNGAALMVNDTQKTLDVLTANPMGGTPRNDLIVFDSATSSIRAIIGTPNAVPTDPTVPATAALLARIRNAASATTIPTSSIDDLRSFTSLFGASPQGKRSYWKTYTSGVTDSNGYATITHGAGFTPAVVNLTPAATTYASSHAAAILTWDTPTSTTFRMRAVSGIDGSTFVGVAFTFSAWLGE